MGVYMFGVLEILTMMIWKKYWDGVDDDDEVTTVDVRGEGGLVLAAQQRGDLDGQTAQDDVLGVDDVPLTVQVSRLRAERAHGRTLSSMDVSADVS